MARRDVNIIIRARDAASRAFKKAEKGAKGFVQSVKDSKVALIATAAAAGSAFYALNRLATVGDDIGKGAKRLGVTVEEYQKLGFAADRAGASVQNIESGFKRMSSAIFDAQQGLQSSVITFEALGISLDELRGLSPEQQFTRIAEALNAVGDASTKAALAQDVFGRSGTQLLPMIGEYRELAEEAERLGLATEKNVKAAEDFKDAMVNLKTSGTNAIMESGILQYFKEVLAELEALIQAAKEFRRGQKGGLPGGGVGRGALSGVVTPGQTKGFFQPAGTPEEQAAQNERARQRRLAEERSKAAQRAKEERELMRDQLRRVEESGKVLDQMHENLKRENKIRELTNQGLQVFNTVLQWTRGNFESLAQNPFFDPSQWTGFESPQEAQRSRTIAATVTRFRTFQESGPQQKADQNLRANEETASNTQNLVDKMDTLASTVLQAVNSGPSITFQPNNYTG